MKVEIGSTIEGRAVAQVGEACEFWNSSSLTPVEFADGKYAIVISSEKGSRIWSPDFAGANQAIENATEMPTVGHGIGSDVIHVRGQDATGRFLVKMFYNSKKIEYGRDDELHR